MGRSRRYLGLVWLLARGEVVLDIPTTATARVRELSRGGRRKNDRIDAAAAASVAALQGDARQVYPETTTDYLALLDERRVNLSHSRTRTVNQLNALLRELMASFAPTSLTSAPPARCADFALAPARIGFGWSWSRTSLPTSGVSMNNSPPTPRR